MDRELLDRVKLTLRLIELQKRSLHPNLKNQIIIDFNTHMTDSTIQTLLKSQPDIIVIAVEDIHSLRGRDLIEHGVRPKSIIEETYQEKLISASHAEYVKSLIAGPAEPIPEQNLVIRVLGHMGKSNDPSLRETAREFKFSLKRLSSIDIQNTLSSAVASQTFSEPNLAKQALIHRGKGQPKYTGPSNRDRNSKRRR